VGYAGGTTINPTYQRIGDHTETFQIDFDPTIIAFTDLLRLFWHSHNPHRSAWSQQYRAIILYHNDAQRQQAQQSREAIMAATKAAVTTEILPLTTFYLAETYHQKYRLQNSALMSEVKMIYPHASNWIDSTAAARLNGYLSGYGLAETFAADTKQLGLSEAGERILLKSMPRQGASLTCPLPR
jgi:peptide-methionine (S)-S-oxide reductase